MSHLSNLTNDNYNTRLLFGNDDLFSLNNIEKYNGDSNKLLQTSNIIPYKYNHDSYLFNNQNNNSNLTILFEQNNFFVPYNNNYHGIESKCERSLKADFTLINSTLYM